MTAEGSPPDERTVRHAEAEAKREEARARQVESRGRVLASRRYNIALAVVVVITVVSLAGMLAMGFLVPEPTPSQGKVLEALQHGFGTGLGALAGLLVGKAA